MKTWQFAALGLAVLWLCGCRTDPAMVLLEQENRQKEDEIYRLRDQLQDCQEELQAFKSHGPAAPQGVPPLLRGPLASPPAAGGARGAPATPLSPPGPGVGTEPAPPAISVPNEPLPPRQGSERSNTPAAPQGPAAHGPDDAPNPDSTAPPFNKSSGSETCRPLPVVMAAHIAPDNLNVAQITLNKALTGGYAAADDPRGRGLLVVVEPRDAQGQLLDAPGDIQVVALDPLLKTRVGRWDLTTAETAALWGGGSDRGIRLHLPWPGDPPTHNRLEIFVRYLTSDGRKLEVSSPVDVVLEGERSTGWVPLPRSPGEPSAPATLPTEQPVAEQPFEGPALPMATGRAEPGPQPPTWSPERY